uniref:Apple domain-containing protein n=1 Tax=Steinernema glaseri TaxID=37863 RepID=A0A1I7Y4I0_9BILA
MQTTLVSTRPVCLQVARASARGTFERMSRWWGVVPLLGALMASTQAAANCARNCEIGYTCVYDDDGRGKCVLSSVCIGAIVVVCIILVVLIPVVCIGMCFCGAFACMPRLFQKTINRLFFHGDKGRKGGRVSYTVKKKRAERAIARKKKKGKLAPVCRQTPQKKSNSDPERKSDLQPVFKTSDMTDLSSLKSPHSSHEVHQFQGDDVV